MPSSSDPTLEAERSAEAALLEKIEDLSMLRSLNDRLTRASDFGSACRTLVELIWESTHAEQVAYYSIDAPRQACRLEAALPAGAEHALASELSSETAPLCAVLAEVEPVALLPGEPLWSGLNALLCPSSRTDSPNDCALIAAPTRVRGLATGLLLSRTTGRRTSLEEERRLLAIVATSAALALDASRREAREEFLAMLRHDINNPVSVALGYTEMIVDRLRSEGQGELRALADSVFESLKSVADLVSNYLHMAAIDRGTPWLSLTEVDLGRLTREIVDGYRPSAAEKGIEVEMEVGSEVVCGDRRQLGRVISNLMSNAIKYTPGPGRIEIRCRGDESGSTLEIRDSGLGLSAGDLAKLFSKYARFHRDRRIPGTGLGLYISRAIVEEHGGQITVESDPRRGSVFTVRLPRRRPPETTSAPSRSAGA
jgi:signal transduction histidine kinase